MPYKSEKLKMPKEYDKRIKLTDKQKEEIKKLYGKIPQRKLANIYGVSRRLIQFIGNPELKEKNLQRLQERGGTRIYYDKERHKKYMKKHRKYKHNLYKQGKLSD